MRASASVLGLCFCLWSTVGCTTATSQVPRSRVHPLKDKPEVYEALRDHYKHSDRHGEDGVDLTRVELYRFSGRAKQYVAICDWQTQWWGDFIVFNYDEDEGITWVAEVEDMPTEQSILSVRPIALPGFAGPCLEVFGTTHMGHGNFYLYHFDIESRKLDLILTTFAVDRHQDGTLIRGGTLLPVYYMPTRFRRQGNIVLVGIVDTYAINGVLDDDEEPIQSRRASKMFFFNASRQRYETDPDQWQGLSAYEGRE